MESVRALGYVPNRIAGSLASLDSRLVGVVIPSLSNFVFPAGHQCRPCWY